MDGVGSSFGTFCFTLCGPKGSLCCTVLSVWGLIMMVVLGAAFKVQAVALFEDIEGKIDFGNHSTPVSTIRDNVDKAYNNAAYSCFGAAFLYFVYLAISSTMVVVNVYRAKNAAARKRR